MIWELDNFLRMRHLGETPADIPYFAVFNTSPIDMPQHIAATYPHLFNSKVRFVVDDHLHAIVAELHSHFPDLFADVGLSHFKGFLRTEPERQSSRLMALPNYPMKLAWVVSHETNIRKTLDYFRRRALTRDFNPLADIPSLGPELSNLLGGKTEKIALIHIRSIDRSKGSAGNAGTKTDPVTLEPTLAYLRDTGYTLVKVGLEAYPPEWSAYGVINYTNSGLLTFSNDMRLLKAASFVMVNASGFQNLPDILETPMVVYGTWPIAAMSPGKSIVHVPTILRAKRNGLLLKFAEQIDRSFSRHQFWEKGDCLNLPAEEFDLRHPASNELLEATKEAISLSQNFQQRSELQNRFIDLSKHHYFEHVEGRISQFFLENFSDALEPGIMPRG